MQPNLEKAKSLFDNFAFLTGVYSCEMVSGELELRQGRTATAKAIFQKCLQWFWMKDVSGSSYCLERMADINRWSVIDFQWASECTVVYLTLGIKTQNKLAMHKALRCLGDVFLANGDEYTAKTLFIVALAGFTYMDVHHSRAECMLRLGDIAKNQGDMAGAAELWSEARRLFERSLQAKQVIQINLRLTGLKLL